MQPCSSIPSRAGQPAQCDEFGSSARLRPTRPHSYMERPCPTHLPSFVPSNWHRSRLSCPGARTRPSSSLAAHIAATRCPGAQGAWVTGAAACVTSCPYSCCFPKACPTAHLPKSLSHPLQASAPHYCLLVTPLAGESRFASAAAKVGQMFVHTPDQVVGLVRGNEVKPSVRCSQPIRFFLPVYSSPAAPGHAGRAAARLAPRHRRGLW